jgi:hypothetical protein
VEANFLDQNDVDLTNKNVENNDAVSDRIGQSSTTNLLPYVFIACICLSEREILGVREVLLVVALVDRGTLLRDCIGLVY